MSKEKMAEWMNESINRNLQGQLQSFDGFNEQIFDSLLHSGVILTAEQKSYIDTLLLNAVKTSVTVSSLVSLEMLDLYFQDEKNQ